jgi:hypothetical protein
LGENVRTECLNEKRAIGLGSEDKMTILSVVRPHHLGKEMNELQPHQKSTIRVASQTVRHLRSFRLLPCQEREMNDDELEAIGRSLLDHAAELLQARRSAPPAPRPGSAAAALVRARRSLLEIAPDRFRR